MKKKFLVAGLSTLLIFGIIAAVNAVTDGIGEGRGAGFFRGFRMKGLGMDKSSTIEDLCLPEDATPEEVMEAIWEKRLEELGLTEDSTIKELKEAVKERMQASWEEKLPELKEKLGLPDDATEEDVKEALKEKREGCKEFCHRRGFRGRRIGGFHGV